MVDVIVRRIRLETKRLVNIFSKQENFEPVNIATVKDLIGLLVGMGWRLRAYYPVFLHINIIESKL
jgi:hypothetical protein